MAFAPTAQQQAFLDALTGTDAHLALEARAGCGKTSTIMLGVNALRAANERTRILVCAFNTAIVKEIDGKLRDAGHGFPHVQAKTAHGLGTTLLKDAYGFDTRRDLNAHKVRDLIQAAAGSSSLYGAYSQQISKLVGMAKQAAVGVFGRVEDAGIWYGLASHHGIELDEADAERIVGAAQDIYTRSCDDLTTFDFDDMILIPLLRRLTPRWPADVVFVDEAQDLSPARQALISKFVKPRYGRLVIVGDPAQAIYGFAGADAQSLSNLIREYRATVLPLSVTWRCPKAVVREAQAYVPDITAADSAPDGSVTSVLSLPQALTPGRDAILCRNTAPLVSTAYSLIRQGTPARVEGRDIGEGLAALARRWKVRTCAELLARLEAHEVRELGKLEGKPDEDEQAEKLRDRLDTLREIIKACQGRGEQLVTDVVGAIAALFGDDVQGAVVLATYHKSKGREWPRVLLLEHHSRCPSRAARQPWQLEQEANLAYVAVTRAQEDLVYVG